MPEEDLELDNIPEEPEEESEEDIDLGDES
jgi:hypothetical protein